MVGFATWARTERVYVEDLERTRQTDQMESLNQGTRAVVDSLQVKLERVENEFKVYRVMQDAKFQLLIDSNDRLTQAILRLTNPVVVGVDNTGAIPVPVPPPGIVNNQPASTDTTVEEPQDFPGSSEGDDDVDAVPPPTAAVAVVVPVAVTGRNQHASSRGHLVDEAFRRRALEDATQVIQDMAIAPPLVNTSCPSTWVKCLRDWRGNNLAYWVRSSADDIKGWDPRVASAYRKRRSIHTEIDRYLEADNAEGDLSRPLCTLDLAAEALDTLRRASGSNLTDHLNLRRKSNPHKQLRRKNNANPLPPPVPPTPPVPPRPPRAAVNSRRREVVRVGGIPRRQVNPTQRPPPVAGVQPARFSDAYVGDHPDRHGGVPPAPFGVGFVDRTGRRNWTTRRGVGDDITLHQLGVAETERRRTQGTLLYREVALRDRRNHNSMDRFGRNQHARNHFFGPP